MKANIENMNTPYLLITVKDDDIVKNETSVAIFNKINGPKNKHYEITDSDHFTMFVEEREAFEVVD